MVSGVVADAGLYGYRQAPSRPREAPALAARMMAFRVLRVLHHGRSCALLLDGLVRAAHIDIDAIEPEPRAELGRVFHHLGRAAEKLRYDRMLSPERIAGRA